MSTTRLGSFRIHSLRGWARATQGALALAALGTLAILLCVGIDYYYVLELRDLLDSLDYDASYRNSQRESIAQTIEIAGVAATIAAVCLAFALALAVLTSLGWLYVAHANLAMLVRKPTFSPAIASVLWLLPALNVITSYLVLDELWKQSDVERAPGKRWRKRMLLQAWWLSNIAGIIVASFIVLLDAFVWLGKELVQQTGGHDVVLGGLALESGVVACSLLSICLLIWLIGWITNDQIEHCHALPRADLPQPRE